MGIPYEEEDSAEISMSPLIDCVFLLLIFFLVSTMAKKKDKDIDISLPQSTSAEEEMPSNENLVIGVDKSGIIYYEGEETTLNMLHRELREISLTDPGRYIRLDSDEETPISRVVEILDLCQFNNLVNVGIRTYDDHYNQK